MNIVSVNKLISIFLEGEPDLLAQCLQETNNYRPYDPGLYLYKIILQKTIEEKFSDAVIELIYTTLKAWNRDSRGAKLSDFFIFKNPQFENKDSLSKLYYLNIQNQNCQQLEETLSITEKLFESLKLVAEDKPPLITFSKTIHFYAPNLLMPVDRTYTLNFFHNYHSILKSPEAQFKKYKKIQQQFFEFAKATDLSCHVGIKWNTNIPKVADNAIIGYQRLKNQKIIT